MSENMSENRRRPHKITVRLSQQEYSTIGEKAKKAEHTAASFLRQLGLKNKVAEPVFNGEEKKLIIRQLQGIGNNLNQLTKLAHERKIGSPTLKNELEKLKEVADQIWQQLCAATQKTPHV